ncbi:ABC transporter ATP-binding protein [Paenibacillus residui]|uniref:ABC transporter ATP-binding protein n=1 Tax=Paenibacillus residui TaxID=629724 RepID=A0ABW3DBX6_9BACL
MNDIAIKLENVSMKYRMASEKISSIKYYFIQKMRKKISYVDFHALNNINFEIYKGEVFGIVGLNGAGKSTLLKIIAGILKPTSGKVTKNGAIAPLIELGAGFNGELSGLENIYLNGLVLGYSKKFIQEKVDEIIEFSELEQFIHTPLKNYSSGMRARLGFSIATIVQPEILIVDEVLSVGDHKFKEKSENKMMSMINGGATVLFVSHSLGQVEKLCNRVAWLEKGQIREIGEPQPIIERFKNEK